MVARTPTGTNIKEFSTGVDGDQRVQGSLPPLPRQRRRRMLVLGVLLVVVGAVTAAYLFTGMRDRTAVVVLARDVPVGTPISLADVATTQVAVDAGVAVIPGRQLQQVVGRIAATDLRRGTLLAASQLTGARVPGPGQQVVPVAVKASQLPARGLQPGDQVLVVATPGQQGQAAAGDGADPLAQDTPAMVDQVSSPDADGTVRVDLVVDAGVGPAIAKQASTGRIGFILTPRGAQ
jgi:SAF domain-containing protein